MARERRIESDLLIKGEWDGQVRQFRKGRIIVALHPTPSPLLTLQNVIRDVRDARVADIVNFDTVGLVAVPDDADIPSIALELSRDDAVEFAEPVFPLIGMANPPSDTLLGQQWGLKCIHAHHAWEVTTGHPDVRIVVLDSGVSLDYFNPGTGPGQVTIHPDLDWTRYIAGRDYIDGTFIDKSGHGTHMTGIIAANTDNHLGVAGVNWHSRVIISRVIGPFGYNDDLGTYTLYQSIMDVIGSKLSFGKTAPIIFNISFVLGPSLSIRKACENAETVGAILCCAAGDMFSEQYGEWFPAAYALEYPNIIAVGATDKHGKTLGDSPNANFITVVAPGDDILSAWPPYLDNPPKEYEMLTGTSPATAFVTGVASLVWSQKPSAPYRTVIHAITETARPLVPGVPLPAQGWGYGLVCAKKAVQEI